ncbi:hypothetical protein JCM7686_2379 [Paracoccus aminophilus JCM 7686]|uniref:Uncharacterized protein n=1 Tax=Paracoccus aminophilus JCM 7686 TaxID=1367847 RepID=S5XPZ8_PARAH|nr:hypothetical protein JCM7686_2379 [Paracoccus aminophilus JCM 7686]
MAGFAAPKAAAAPEPASVTVSEQPTRPTRPAAPAVSAAATPAPSAPKAAKAAAPTPEAAPAPVQAPVQVQAQAQAQEQSFNILIVAQNGTLAREAVLFAASLRRNSPNWQGQLIVAEPLPEGAWSGARTRIPDAERALLTGYGAEILPFTARHFGRAYPYGNKIEALALLPAKENFIFFDTDTLILGPLDQIAFNFARPSASMRREGTWPEPPLYGPGYAEIWKSLYDRFQLPFETSLDPTRSEDDWERYLYFNAGWFFGSDPDLFGRRFLDAALKVQADPGEALACQSLDPWLDQATLPLVIHSFLGGRPGPELDGLDGAVTCHYRNLSLLYAREPEAALSEVETLLADPKIAALFAQDAGAQKLVVQGEGRKVLRPLFAGGLPPSEKAMRQVLKRSELWFPQ